MDLAVPGPRLDYSWTDRHSTAAPDSMSGQGYMTVSDVRGVQKLSRSPGLPPCRRLDFDAVFDDGLLVNMGSEFEPTSTRQSCVVVAEMDAGGPSFVRGLMPDPAPHWLCPTMSTFSITRSGAIMIPRSYRYRRKIDAKGW